MPLVPAKCTQCGASLTLDPSQEAAVCPFCKTPFIVEKAINNYCTTNITNIETLKADTVNIINGGSAEELIAAGETFINLNDFQKAISKFEEVCDRFPNDARGYQELIKALSANFNISVIANQILDTIQQMRSNNFLFYLKREDAFDLYSKLIAVYEKYCIIIVNDMYESTDLQKIGKFIFRVGEMIQNALEAEIKTDEGRISAYEKEEESLRMDLTPRQAKHLQKALVNYVADHKPLPDYAQKIYDLRYKIGYDAAILSQKKNKLKPWFDMLSANHQRLQKLIYNPN